jgi:exosortase
MRHIVGLLVMLAAGFYVTRAAWLDILQFAINDEESTQIWLVPLVFAWLIWSRRSRARLCARRGRSLGVAIVAAGWAMMLFGDMQYHQALWHLGAVMVVVGCAVTVLGADLLWRFAPAFVVLLFLIPVPGTIRQQISVPAQSITAEVTEALLQAGGAHVERSGITLSINDTPVTVAEACNGLRMVFTLALVTYAFAFGTPLRTGVRLTVLILSPVLAIAFNVFRLVPTVLVYGYATKTTADLFHDWAGWVMVGLAFATLMGVLWLMRWAMVPVTRYTLAYD